MTFLLCIKSSSPESCKKAIAVLNCIDSEEGERGPRLLPSALIFHGLLYHSHDCQREISIQPSVRQYGLLTGSLQAAVLRARIVKKTGRPFVQHASKCLSKMNNLLDLIASRRLLERDKQVQKKDLFVFIVRPKSTNDVGEAKHYGTCQDCQVQFDACHKCQISTIPYVHMQNKT